MEYTLRKPKATDIFVVSKIIKGIGLKNIKDCFNTSDINELRASLMDENKLVDENGKVTYKNFSDEQLTKFGVEMVTSVGDLVLERMEVVQKDLINLISNLTGLSIKEVEDLPIADFAEIVIAIVKEPDFVDFIKVVLKSFN